MNFHYELKQMIGRDPEGSRASQYKRLFDSGNREEETLDEMKDLKIN